MLKRMYLAAAIVALAGPLAHGFTITPTYVDGNGQTWDATKRSVIQQAINEWTSLLSYVDPNQNINMTFDFTHAGTSGYLGQWDGSYSAFQGDSINPWSQNPTGDNVTHIIHFNVDLMTARGSTFPDNVVLNFSLAAPTSNQWDALSVARHELGHALGFSDLYVDSVGNSSNDKWQDHITGSTFDPGPGGLNIALASSSNVEHWAGSTDLMSVSLLNGIRRAQGFENLEALSLAYGYAIIVPTTNSYTSSTFKTGTITVNGTVMVNSTAATRGTPDVVATSSNLSIGANGRLDITNHDMIIRGGLTLAQVGQQVAAGRGDGTFNGTHGITSSTALAAGLDIGWNRAGDLSISTFDGDSVNANDTVLKYTFLGDANFDGKVDLLDLTQIANHWQTNNVGWMNGDIDGSGFVDLLDLTAVANNWQKGVPPGFTGQSFASAMAEFSQFANVSVPEPASMGVMGLGAMLLLRRPKRKS